MIMRVFYEHFAQILVTLWSLAALESADGASVTWHEPLPVKTTTTPDDDLTPAETKLLEGYPGSLSWNFSLTSVNPYAVVIKFNTKSLAGGPTVSVVNVADDLKDRFNITKISQRLTLVIFNVTAAYDESNGQFSCELLSLAGGWTRRIQVKVVAPSRITSSPGRQTVTEGFNLDLYCNVTGKPAPNITWTRVLEDGTNSKVLFVGSPWRIVNIRRNFTGQYHCTADNGIGSPVNHTFPVIVLFKPDNVTLERNTTENNGCTDMWVNFTCKSSEANPPVHNYVLHKDATHVGVSEKGTWIEKISRGETFVYKCQANQQVHNVTSTNNFFLSVKVPVAVEQIQNVTVEEGRNVTKECNVTAGTHPRNCFWKNVKTGQVTKGKLLTIINIRRNQSGEYRCTANNTCGNESTGMFIDVQFKPDNVTLERNTTENNGCTDMWVNFTCKSSEANPPVHNYVLLRNETDVGLSEKGTWIEKISPGETFVYKCQAYHQVDNVTSTNNIFLSVKVPVTVEQIQNVTVEEGRNVTKDCNVTAGTHPLNVFWKNVKTGQVTKGKRLTIINIRRNQSGEYRCTANNTCGNESTGMFIDVHFKPDNVTLERNTTENNGCTDMWVNFTCKSSEANPPVYNYVLLKNEADVGLSEKGTWIEKISRGETFDYKCQANQLVDNVTSTNNNSLSVKVPVAVEQIQNVTVEEGRNVTKECNVTAGTHPLNVFWKNVKTGQVTKGKLLTIINIRRNQSGEYRCTANNTCGNESTGMFIDVHYGPDQVNLDIAPSGTGCRGSTVQFTCTADANPPVHTYVLFQNGTRDSTNESGTWTKTMNSVGKFVFKCEVQSLKGNGTSKDTLLNVDDPPAVKLTSKVTVKEGENVTGECNLTAGTPPPYQFWQNVKTGQFVKTGKLLTITNITRHQTEYKCVANNTCGRASATMFIDVKYGPSGNPLKIKPVTEGEHVAIPCLEDSGNPPAVVTWYKGNDTSGNETTNSSTLEVQNAAPSDEGWYTCFAKNDVGNASATFFLRVAPKTSSAPITEPSTVSILCSKALSENELRVSVTVEADCKNGSQVADKLVDEIVELLKNESCELGVSCVINCGSVVVDSVLKFSKAIDGARVVSILKEAAEQGRFKGLKVVSNSIFQISYTTTSSASTESPSPTEPVCQKSFSEKENCTKNWLNIGIVVCIGVVLFVIICCLITRWVLKQRKCKKDTRVANSPVDVQPLSSNHSTLSGDKPCDYAMSGPQPPIDVKVAVCEEIPTYAVVDKAKKKDKKKNKKAAEQKAIDDQYAVVDKSKKNKKNEPDNTYAEVDMSNKSKKKPKPGEVLYADLGEFHQMQKLPEVSTSPKTLPPIKRPEAYTETQYADITQFFKGNPEATGADHPKDGAASSASSNGQGPATGSKEESSAGNTGDSAGATNETGF